LRPFSPFAQDQLQLAARRRDEIIVRSGGPHRRLL